jgi:lipoate-protein ligase A
LRLSYALLAGLHQIGVAADKAAGHVRAGPNASAACFEIPSAYEITVAGRKLIGSAQSRRAGYVLQHGSLPLVGDIGRLVDVLALPPRQADHLRRELSSRAGTLAQALGVADDSPLVHFEPVAQTLYRGFAATLKLALKPAQPTPNELRRAAQLIREQFANPAWTETR